MTRIDELHQEYTKLTTRLQSEKDTDQRRAIMELLATIADEIADEYRKSAGTIKRTSSKQ